MSDGEFSAGGWHALAVLSVGMRSLGGGLKAANMRLLLFCSFSLVVAARGQVLTYEGTAFPETTGWQRDAALYPAQRWIDDGWLVQETEPLPDGPEQDVYRRSVAEFAGAESFFVEWRMFTNGPRTGIPSGASAGLAPSGNTGIAYHFTIAGDQARLINSDLDVILFDIQHGDPHIYRLEIRVRDYLVLIDGQQVYSGTTALSYPTSDSRIVFWARAPAQTSTTRWDYIRYGRIPQITPGDVNCDGAINFLDIDPFLLAVFDPNAYEHAHPDCLIASADLDGDDLVNFFDIDPFVACLFGDCP